MSRTAQLMLDHDNDPPYFLHWSAVYGDLSAESKRDVFRHIYDRVELPLVVPITAITVVDATGHLDEWQTVERYSLGV